MTEVRSTWTLKRRRAGIEGSAVDEDYWESEENFSWHDRR